MPEPFSVDNGLMTPTLKLRRHLIVKAYRELLEGLYGSKVAACSYATSEHERIVHAAAHNETPRFHGMKSHCPRRSEAVR